MLRKLRPRSIYDVFALLALLVAAGGTSAYAANTIHGSDIIDNEISTVDVRDDTFPFGGLYAQDLAAGSVGTSEVANDSLTGNDISDGTVASADILNGSLGNGDFLTGSVDSRVATNNSLTGTDINESTLVGVKDGDSCGSSGAALFGGLCAGSDGASRTYFAAQASCVSIGLRLPTWSEAVLLAVKSDVPGVGAFPDQFWTDEIERATFGAGNAISTTTALAVDENGNGYGWNNDVAQRTVCVTTPD